MMNNAVAIVLDVAVKRQLILGVGVGRNVLLNRYRIVSWRMEDAMLMAEYDELV